MTLTIQKLREARAILEQQQATEEDCEAMLRRVAWNLFCFEVEEQRERLRRDLAASVRARGKRRR